MNPVQYVKRFLGLAAKHSGMSVTRVGSLPAYETHFQNMVKAHHDRWVMELELSRSGTEFSTPGRCFPCQKDVDFKTDFQYTSTHVNGQLVPNWRERVLCPCQLNNRTRASIQFLEEILGAHWRDSVYIAEQVTPLYKALKKRFPKLVGSEYLGDAVEFGKKNKRGIRNESITKLTFDDNAFQFVLNFDVLEHIPNPEDGLKEIYRVLAEGGKLLMSVPFLPMQQDNVVRARLDSSGGVEHLLEPQYHGDPVSSASCLCFQDFGWDLFDNMRKIGFRNVDMLLYWSAEYGYYGVEQMLITAEK
jgi:SAM-dependent methyltransferase